MIPGQVYATERPANNKSYSVDVHLQTDNGKAVSSATLTVIDANSGEVLGRSKVQSGDFTFYAPNRPCTLRVQVDGYAIVERQLSSASRDDHPTGGFGRSRGNPADIPQVTKITFSAQRRVIVITAAVVGLCPQSISLSYGGGTVFKIVHAQFLAPGIKRFVIEAPRIARKQQPGQFVILRIYEEGERIPVTIENSDPEKGTINIVVQSAGKTTNLLNTLETGDSILDVVGPLGKPSDIRELRHRGRGWRRSGYGDGVSHGGGAEASGQPRDLDRGRAQQRTGHPRKRNARRSAMRC